MPLGADVTFEERCVGEEGELRQLALQYLFKESKWLRGLCLA